MKSEIIFLGTGGARFVTAKQLLATGGIVIRIGEKQIWIDPGPGALVRAKQYGVEADETDIVLVSHVHIDHSNDMNAVIDAMTNGGFRNRGHVVSVKEVIEETLSKHIKKSLTSVNALKTGENIKFGDISITATRTKHDIEEIGFKIATPDFTVGYTADTDYFSGIEKEYSKCDILIVNTIRPSGKPLEKHMDSDKCAKLLEKVKPKLAIITAFGLNMIKADPLQEARKIEKISKVTVIAAKDGLRINPVDYSAKTDQKTLANF